MLYHILHIQTTILLAKARHQDVTSFWWENNTYIS